MKTTASARRPKPPDGVSEELAQILVATGIDLSTLPPICTPGELSPILGVTTGSLANDRYRGVGLPFVKHGRRVRYLRADIARYLLANRTEHNDPISGHR